MLEHDYKDTTFFFMLREKITQKFHIDQNRKENTMYNRHIFNVIRMLYNCDSTFFRGGWLGAARRLSGIDARNESRGK